MSVNAETQRRYRRRRRKGIAVVGLPLHYYALVEALLAAGRISDSDAVDKGKVEAAAANVLSEWAAKWR